MVRGKKGLELSVNFMVILILAIVVFGMGIIIAVKMLSSGQTLVTEVNDDLRRDMQRMLTSHEQRIAIPYPKMEVKKGKTAGIVLGLQNVIATQDFEVKMSLGTPGALNPDEYIRPSGGSAIACPSPCGVKYGAPPGDPKTTVRKVQEQAYEVFLFPISTRTAKKGTYLFTLEVTCSQCSATNGRAAYDAPQKVLVVVT